MASQEPTTTNSTSYDWTTAGTGGIKFDRFIAQVYKVLSPQ